MCKKTGYTGRYIASSHTRPSIMDIDCINRVLSGHESECIKITKGDFLECTDCYKSDDGFNQKRIWPPMPMQLVLIMGPNNQDELIIYGSSSGYETEQRDASGNNQAGRVSPGASICDGKKE